MYTTFKDENADKMRDVAKSITPEARFVTAGEIPLNKSEHPIANQFFEQPEHSVQPLDTQELIDSLAGRSPLNDRFRAAVQAQYPLTPELWGLTPPQAMDVSTGGMTSRFRQKAERSSLSKSVEPSFDGLSPAEKEHLAAEARKAGAEAQKMVATAYALALERALAAQKAGYR
jgi:hypothetical protein